MNTQQRWYLICYDIRSTKRLQQLHRYLRTQGYALQESVFAWQGDLQAEKELKKVLQKLIKPQEDDLRLYRLPLSQTIQIWGKSPFADGVFNNGYPPHRINKT